MSMLNDLKARHPLLEEEPENDDQRQRLTEELKSRGNGAFKSKSMREALVLYSRAIELTPGDHALLGNRSMVQLELGEFQEALDDAEKAIALNDTWSKGPFRKAKALDRLERYSEASFAMEEAVRLTDTEKGKKPLLKLVAEYQKKAAEKPAAPAAESTTVDKDRFKKGGEGGDFGGGAMGSAVAALNNQTDRVDALLAPAPKKSPAPAPAKEPTPKVAKPASSATPSTATGDMKGYKTLADGRKTSFFHMEVSEEAKRLQAEQGGFAPKKIDTTSDATQFESTAGDSGASVWNSSGTFEEKDQMKWGGDKLTELLVGAEGDTPRFTNVDEVEGDCLYTFRKGKRGCVFDLNFVAHWAADGKKGKCSVSNFANDGGSSDGDEYELSWTGGPSAEAKEALTGVITVGLVRWLEAFTQ